MRNMSKSFDVKIDLLFWIGSWSNWLRQCETNSKSWNLICKRGNLRLICYDRLVNVNLVVCVLGQIIKYAWSKVGSKSNLMFHNTRKNVHFIFNKPCRLSTLDHAEPNDQMDTNRQYNVPKVSTKYFATALWLKNNSEGIKFV